MKIAVKDITDDGLDFAEELDARLLGLAIKERLVYETPLKMRAHATRTGKRSVRILGEVKAGVQWTCSRCMQEFRRPLRQSFELNYTDKDQDSVIDPTDLIREEVFLSYPMHTLCKNVCKGLCLMCGHNLNEGLCDCRDNGSLSFGKLKDMVR